MQNLTKDFSNCLKNGIDDIVTNITFLLNKNIEMEKKKAMNELKDEISGISVQIAQTVMEREIKEEDHKELIDSFIDNL